MSPTILPQLDAGFGAADILKALGRRWYVLLICAAIGVGAALVLLLRVVPLYEATAAFRNAQVAGVQVETQPQALARLQMQVFLNEAGVTTTNVFVGPLRGTDAMEVRYRAVDASEAEAGVRAIFELFAQRQEQLSEPGKASMRRQLEDATRVRNEAAERKAKILEKLPAFNVGAVKNTYPFLDAAFVAQEVETAKWESSIRSAMSPAATTPARLIEEISVAKDPIRPSKTRYLAAGLIGGLCFGAFIAFLQYLLAMVRSSRQAAAVN